MLPARGIKNSFFGAIPLTIYRIENVFAAALKQLYFFDIIKTELYSRLIIQRCFWRNFCAAEYFGKTGYGFHALNVHHVAVMIRDLYIYLTMTFKICNNGR